MEHGHRLHGASSATPGGGQQDAVNSSGPTCTAQPCTAGVRTSQLTSNSQNQSGFSLERYAGHG